MSIIVAIYISIGVAFSTVGFLAIRWITKATQTEQRLYKYVLVPTNDQIREFHAAIRDGATKPIRVQPNESTVRNGEKFGAYNSVLENPELPDVCQTPLISAYECKKTTRRSRKPKGNLRNSFKETASKICSASVANGLSQVETNPGNVTHSEQRQAVKPELTFSIFYDLASKELHVTVICATNPSVFERLEGTKSTQYYQVKVRVEPWETQWRATRHVSGSRKLAFRETFIVSGFVHHKLRECTVHFVVVEFEEYQHRWNVVGEVNVSLVDFRANQLMKVTKKLYQT